MLITKSHPEMVSDMSRVTLNCDLRKFLLCVSSQGQDILTPEIKHLAYIYWFSSESGRRRRRRRRRRRQRRTPQYNH